MVLIIIRNFFMAIFDYISIFLALITLVWSIFIFVKQRRFREARYMSFLTFFSGLWILSVSVTNLSYTPDLVIIFTITSIFTASLAVTALLFFVTVFRFPDKLVFKQNKVILLLVLFFVLLLIIVPNKQLVTNIEIYYDKPPLGQ